MKPQYDVNDNGQSRYEDPKQSYKELDNTGNSNPAIVNGGFSIGVQFLSLP